MAKDRYHDWYKLYDKLSVEINPDPEELKQLFNQESPIDPINLRGLELKFEAATREPTAIEKNYVAISALCLRQSFMDKRSISTKH